MSVCAKFQLSSWPRSGGKICGSGGVVLVEHVTTVSNLNKVAFELLWVELSSVELCWVLTKKNMKLSQPQLLNTTLKQPEVYSPRIFKNFNLTRIQSSCLFVYKSLYRYNIIQAAMIHTDLQLDFDIGLLSFLGLKIFSYNRLWNIKLGL